VFVHRFSDTIYERKVTFLVCSGDEYQDYLHGLGLKHKLTKGACGETASHLLPSEFYPGIKTKHFFVWMQQFNDDARDTGTLAHECFHVTQDVMQEVGVEYFLDDANEPYAYYTDSLVKQFLIAWRAQSGKG
jgi:hypothetical protein